MKTRQFPPFSLQGLRATGDLQDPLNFIKSCWGCQGEVRYFCFAGCYDINTLVQLKIRSNLFFFFKFYWTIADLKVVIICAAQEVTRLYMYYTCTHIHSLSVLKYQSYIQVFNPLILYFCVMLENVLISFLYCPVFPASLFFFFAF